MALEPVARTNSGTASTFNAANVLTLVRLLLVPAFVALLFASGGELPLWQLAAASVFLLASVTDRVDGELARRRGLVTDFGKVADPIADKTLMGAALISLSALGELAWWMTVAILARELGVTLLRFVVMRHGVIPASRGGKLKTALQSVAILGYLLPFSELATARVWVMGAAVAVTLGTALDYIIQAIRLRRASAK